MKINEKCAGCKKLCKALATEDVSKCQKYEPLKKDVKKNDQKVVYIKRR